MKTHILILSSLLLLVSCGSETSSPSASKDTGIIQENALKTNTTKQIIAIDPSTVDSLAITTASSTGTTERPRN